MPTQVEVVYPSTPAFSGAAQLNLGPYFVPAVQKLLRAEVRGKFNFQAFTIGATSVEANFQLWALQWVPHGAPPADCITTADGPRWLIRQQIGTDEQHVTWAPSTATGATMASLPIWGEWAGQQKIGADIDLYLSARAPTGVAIGNMNAFGSIRFWWN